MSNSQAKPGDYVELKHKDSGFTDPESGFDISRAQRVQLGDTIGSRTHQALMSGGLLLVSGKGKKGSKDDDESSADELPADLPGRDAFIAAGFTTLDAVKAIKEEDLTQIKGVGAKTVENLKAWTADKK